MSELLNKWVARISKAKRTDGKLERGKTVGTGFISVYPWLITCNHVAADCIGQRSTDTLAIGEITGMVIDFPLYPEKANSLFHAELVASKPKLTSPNLDDIHDIAILKLKLVEGGDIEDDEWASEWKYDQSGNCIDHAVSAKGFFIEQVSLLEGSSKTSCTDGLIELDLNIDESIKGASGSPVWSKDDLSIIGMLASQRGENAPNFKYEKVYMVPMHKILDACLEHKAVLLAYKEAKLGFETDKDSSFLGEIQTHIADELMSEDVTKFKELLSDELNKLLKPNEENSITSNQEIAQNLIDALKIGSTDVPVITKVLMKATLHCLDRRNGKFYRENQGKHEAIKDAVEQILGWLIVASVNDHNLRDMQPFFKSSSSMYFELPVLTSAGVEIIVARQTERRAYLEAKESLYGAYVLEIGAETFDWKGKNIVTDLMIKIWNHVLPEKQKQNNTEPLSENEIKELNAELEIRRADDFYKEHHILAINSERKDMNHETYENLLRNLDQLTLVCFGFEEQQIFYSPEQRLAAAIKRFLTKVNEALK